MFLCVVSKSNCLKPMLKTDHFSSSSVAGCQLEDWRPIFLNPDHSWKMPMLLTNAVLHSSKTPKIPKKCVDILSIICHTCSYIQCIVLK